MKKIRLVVPHNCGEKQRPKRVWLKISDTHVECFEDRECTIPLSEKVGKIFVEVNVPKELELIEVLNSGGTTPVQDISLGWCMLEANSNWRVPGLKKVSIIMDDRTYEVPVINEKPDRENWYNYIENDEEGKWLFTKRWALAVYTLETRTIASFYMHSALIEEFVIPKRIETRKIELSIGNKLPCMWEKGGRNHEECGHATIICGENGKPKKPIYIRRKGDLGCSEHALIGVQAKDIIIEVVINKYDDLRIDILKIDSISGKKGEAKVYAIAKYYNGKWRCAEIAAKYKDAYVAACDKATTPYCDIPYYIARRS